MAIDMEDFEIAFGERFAGIVARRPIIPPHTRRDPVRGELDALARAS